MKTLGIAFSGSGLNLGFHDGVIDHLVSVGIVPDVILGTSGGAVVGSMWAMDKRDLLRHYLLAITGPGDVYVGGIRYVLAGQESLYTWPSFKQLALTHIRSEDFQVPFYAGVVDDREGLWQMVSHVRPWIAEAVLGSSSVIPFVPPEDLASESKFSMVDGGFFYPLGNLDAFVQTFGLQHLIVVDATRGTLSKPRWQERTFRGNIERSAELLSHQVYLHNRRQIDELRRRGIHVILIEPAYHLGGGMRVEPGEIEREIAHGREQAAKVIQVAFNTNSLTR